ncbi:MAG TPA: hypothetical protein VHC70_08325 [Phycisphaerales bacterium]|nr:hypothetical protein [Phycisphaerales bacterium]
MLHSEPQIAPPIEDQILEAIISASLPTDSEAPTGTGFSGPDPNRNPNPNLPSPLALAAAFHLPLSKILDILASPLTRTRLAAAQELRDLAFHQREQSAREKALAALENILDTSEDPIEKRRAATAILRRHSNRNPFWPRTPGAGATTLDLDEDEDLDEDAAPPRAPLPDPEFPRFCRPAQETLIRLLTRLQDNHNPTPNAGLATLFRHKHEANKLEPAVQREALADYLEAPGEDANLTNFSCAILHTTEPDPNLPAAWAGHKAHPPGHERTHRVTLHWPDHHRTVQLRLINAGNGIADLWQIAGIEIGPKQTTPDSS